MRTPIIKKAARFLGVSAHEIIRSLRPFNYKYELSRLKKPLDFKLLSLVIPHGASRDFLDRFEEKWDACVEEVLWERDPLEREIIHELLYEIRPENTELHRRILMLCEEVGVGEFTEEPPEIIVNRIKHATTIIELSDLFSKHARYFKQKDVNRWFQEARQVLKEIRRREEVITLWKHLPPHYRRLREDVIHRALRISNKSRAPRKKKHTDKTIPF